MGPIIDNILNMTDEKSLLLHKKIKEFVEIEQNATIREKREIYNNTKLNTEYRDICDIFEELAFVF